MHECHFWWIISMTCICFSDECILFIVNWIFKRIASFPTLFTKTLDKLLRLSAMNVVYFILQTYFSNIYVYVYVEQIVQTNRIHQLIQFLTRSSSVNIERQMTRNTPAYGWFRTSPITKQYFIGYNNHKVRE